MSLTRSAVSRPLWLAFALIAVLAAFPSADAQAESGSDAEESEVESDAEESEVESDAEESEVESDAEDSDAEDRDTEAEASEAPTPAPTLTPSPSPTPAPAPTPTPAPTLTLTPAPTPNPALPPPPEPEPSPEPTPAPPPCLSAPVTIERAHSHPLESLALRLTHCDGSPNLAALRPLSTLGRAARTERAAARLHRGLLTRLQAIANQFPGRAIAIVSGHRPGARRTSRHRHGRALDIRVEGVHRRDVSEFARGLADTGVGYYPNSTFTHVDVRGRAQYWVDRSAPGQRPDYGPWPPSRDVTNEVRRAIAAATTRAFGAPVATPSTTRASASPALSNTPAAGARATSTGSGTDALVVPENEESRPPADVRDEAFAALEALRGLDLRTP